MKIHIEYKKSLIFAVMRLLRGFGIVGLMLVINTYTVYSQNSDCQNILVKAKELFVNGEFDAVIGLYENKLNNCRFSKEEQLELYKITSSSYFEIDEIESGNDIMRKFLRRSPSYIANPNFDPVSFARAFNTFRVYPKFAIGMNVGVCHDRILVSKIYQVSDSINYKNNYQSGFLPTFHFYMKWYPFHFMSLSTGVGIVTHSYTKLYTGNHSMSMYMTENYSSVNVPIIVSLMPYKTRKFTPAFYFGVYQNAGAGAECNATMKVNDSKEQTLTYDFKAELTDSYRNLDHNGILLGTSMSYKFGSIELFADYRYSHQFKQLSTDVLYPSLEMPVNLSILTDEFKLDYMEFTIGIQINILHSVSLIR